MGATGSDLMEYDDLSLLVRKTDRKGQILVMQYDEMGRNTAVIHYKSNTDYLSDNSVRRVETVYNNRGNAVRISSDVLVEYYNYDHNNRVTKLERYLKNQNMRQQVASVWGGDPATQKFAFGYTYNDAGMVTQMTYPDGSVHQYQYDGALGRLQGINAMNTAGTLSPFVTSLQYTPAGVVNRMDYANMTAQTWNFDNRKRISRIWITGPNGVLEDLNYKLNASGDILSINENEYTYDGFDRIIGAKTLLPDRVDTKKLVAQYFGTYVDGDPVNGFSYQADIDLNSDGRINGDDHTMASLLGDETNYDIESFAYDKNGNRTQLVQNVDTYTYQYGDRNQLEAVYVKRKNVANVQLFIKYEYDLNGNTISKTLYTDQGEVKTSLEYDTLNRLLKTTEAGKITEYLYDNAGNRFIKKGPNGITLFLRYGQTAVAMDIEMPLADPSIKGKINRYILSGELLAGRITRIVKNDGTESANVSYYHLDHLNSTKCVSNANGEVEVRYIYRAFGSQLAKIGSGDAKYTYGGKQLDDETNLYYYGARFYDAEIGRFITEDPAKDGLNWYVYCNNNPLSFKDPTGLKTCEGENTLIHTFKGNEVFPSLRDVLFNFSLALITKDTWIGSGALSTALSYTGKGEGTYIAGVGDTLTRVGKLYGLTPEDSKKDKNIPKGAVYSLEWTDDVISADKTGHYTKTNNVIYFGINEKENYYYRMDTMEPIGENPFVIYDLFDVAFSQGNHWGEDPYNVESKETDYNKAKPERATGDINPEY